MKKIYCLLFAMLPLAAFAGEVKVTKPALTLENDTLTLDFKFNMEAVKVNSTNHTHSPRYCLPERSIRPCLLLS